MVDKICNILISIVPVNTFHWKTLSLMSAMEILGVTKDF